MHRLPLKVAKSLENRKEQKAFRQLKPSASLVDFSSNDYLGLCGSMRIFENSSLILEQKGLQRNGSGGSRLLSGNHLLYTETESLLAGRHHSEAAIILNSGYDANLGLLSSVAKRGDLVLL